MLELQLTPEIERILADVSARTGQPAEEIARQALLVHLEDLEDYALAVEAMKEYDPATSISGEEVMRELGMAV